LPRAMLDERPYDRELVFINLLDDTSIPRFPEPVMGEPRDSEANREAVNEAEEMIAEITARRSEGYERLSRELAEDHGAETLETYWLIKAMLVELPLSAVPDLARREDVLHIRPDDADDVLPQRPTPNMNLYDDVDDGRARMSSDPYFNLGLTGGYIGLIDSGVRRTHTLIDFFSDTHGGAAL
jgi:serine protease AprX